MPGLNIKKIVVRERQSETSQTSFRSFSLCSSEITLMSIHTFQPLICGNLIHMQTCPNSLICGKEVFRLQ